MGIGIGPVWTIIKCGVGITLWVVYAAESVQSMPEKTETVLKRDVPKYIEFVAAIRDRFDVGICEDQVRLPAKAMNVYADGAFPTSDDWANTRESARQISGMLRKTGTFLHHHRGEIGSVNECGAFAAISKFLP